jgi:hypothetical protein
MADQKGPAFTVGCYEWTFYAGDYFAATSQPISGQPFLDVVPLRYCFDRWLLLLILTLTRWLLLVLLLLPVAATFSPFCLYILFFCRGRAHSLI